MSTATRRRRRRRRRRKAGLSRRLRRPVLWMLLIVAAGLSLNIYLVVRPANLQALVRERLAAVFLADFEFSTADFSLRRGVEIHDFRLGPESGGGWALETRLVRVVPRLGALLAGRFELKEVFIAAPVARVAREAGGAFNVARLLRPQPTEARRAFPRLRIEGGRLVYQDAATFAEPVEESAEVSQLIVEAGPDGRVALRAELAAEGARRLAVTGSFPPGPAGAGAAGRLRLQALKLDLGGRLARFLPAETRARFRELRLRGFADVEVELELDAAGSLVPRGSAGSLVSCDLQPPGLPFPVHGLRAAFSLRDGKLEVKNVGGGLGTGALSGAATAALSESFALEEWSGRLRVEGFTVDGRLRAALGAEFQEIFDDYRPQGPVDVEVAVTGARRLVPEPDHVRTTVRFQGLEITYHEFPYLLEDLRGEVVIQGRELKFTVPLVARQGPVSVTIAGEGVEMIPDGRVDIALKIKDVPLDERLRAALPAQAIPIWDSFQLAGVADATVSVTRESPGSAMLVGAQGPKRLPRLIVATLPRGVRLMYRGFPYEVTGITGSCYLDTGTGRLTFLDLEGKHGEQTITAEKCFVQLAEPALVQIGLHADSLAIDGDLVGALAERERQLLEDFGFEGRVAADVSIHSTGGGNLEVVADLDLMEGRLEHQRFPFPLELGGGKMKIVGGQLVEFRRVRTREGVEPVVVFDGDLVTRGTVRDLGFAFEIGALRFNEKLVAALPPVLKSFVQNIGLDGLYRGNLRGAYRFDEEDPSALSISYKGSDISTTDGAVDFGLKIGSMKARGEFIGRVAPGVPHAFYGRVNVESARFNRLHLTNGDITFVYGAEHEAVAAARNGKRLDNTDYLPPPAMVARLVPDKVSETFQMIVHSPDLYGGQVDGFLYVDGGEAHDLGGDFTGKGLEVAKAAEDVFGVAAGTGTRGTASGKIEFTGRTGDLASITGKGQGAIENARLVELPLFLGLLSAIFGEGSGRHYFNAVRLDYTIGSGMFVADSNGIEIRSQGLKLVGGGTMDFAGNLSLTLLPQLLDVKLPIVDSILWLLKKGLAQVWITGDLREPKMQFATGAGALRFGIGTKARETPANPLPSDLREGQKEEKEEKEGKEGKEGKEQPKQEP